MKLATASSCPNAGTASIVANAVPAAPVPPADVPTMVATDAVQTAKFAVVNGDALVCIQNDATKPGRTFEGNAIFVSPN
jgi:alkanesulfonate monooxygenase SsuD/methylene tetrahydromethanopterin reductase-like flavin-dependent oxidoreductase (luciferase family)